MRGKNKSKTNVAPFTGAWIETAIGDRDIFTIDVAPFTGAWIETLISARIAAQSSTVAPFTGAWIETQEYST